MRRFASARARAIAASVAVATVVLLFALPTRAYLAQRGQLARQRAVLAMLDRENRKLAGEAKRLQTPAEVERQAREQFQMVRPGEEAYAVIPVDPAAAAGPATTTTTVPARTPAPTQAPHP